MAEISSPISGGIQVARSTVSSSTFGIGRSALQPVRSEPDPETLRVLRDNQTSLLLISNQIESLSFRMVDFRNSLEKISSLIESDSFLERQREVQNQQQEKQLAEQQLREGKESIIEKKIQAALLQPVQAIGEKTRSVLGSLMEFFTTLLGGWLINQGVETIKALGEGNKEKLEQIKNDTLSQLGIIGRIFTILRTGFFGVFRTLTSLTGRITSAIAAGLFINPMRNLLQGLPGRGGRRTPSPRVPRGPQISGGIGSLTGRIATLASALMNFFNGENVDAILAAATLFGPGRIIKIAASLGYAADEIAELFGSNIFGKDPRAEKLKEAAEKEKKQSRQVATTSTKLESTENLKLTEAEKKQLSEYQQKAQIESAETTPTISELPISTPSMSMLPESLGSMTEEPTKIISVPGLKPQTGEEQNNLQIGTKPKSTQEKVQTLSSLSEPQPNIIMLPANQQQSTISRAPSASGNVNSVPTIQSSNPENFYVLYSQVQYNVVM
jgi:hypothetical protein